MRLAPIRLIVVAALLALAACSSSSDSGDDALPPAGQLLKRSAAEMRTVPSARFDLQVDGTLGGIPVKRATGTITSDGRAAGTADIQQGDSLVEIDLVVVDDRVYIKGPTGSYIPLPSGVTGGIFDPSQILNPTQGLSALLASAKRGKTLGEERVGGVDAYRVRAVLEADLLGRLMPLSAAGDVPATLWIGKATPDLLRVRVSVPAEDGQDPTVLTLSLSDFGVEADITPPA